MQKLNINQEKAVMWKDGPCLVLAGPGSGKTFVLVNRILNLIRSNVDPTSILIITFTRAAANEMKDRFARLSLEEGIHISDTPTFGTFHSVFYEILKNDFGYTGDSLISYDEKRKILFNIIEKRNDLKISMDFIDNILSDIDSYKSSLEKEENFSPKYLSDKLFFDIYGFYDERLYNKKKLDFYDMIGKCRELLIKNERVLKYYRDRYKYILIDEFQDINKSQYDIVKLICKNDNLFVVGDDDQSIYKFRGSRPRVMRDFLNDYNRANIIKLTENYRCAKVIVKYSKRIIDHNVDRFEKDLVAKRDDIGHFEIKACDDSKDENELIIDKIRRYNSKGIKLSEMAILYRTNLLSRSICKTLDTYNIPYDIKGLDKSPYDHFAISDVISYLKIAIGLGSTEDFVKISNKPLRYVSRDAISFKNVSIDSIIKYYSDVSFMYKPLSKLKYDINEIKKTITPLAIRYIRVNVGYDEYLKKYCEEKKIDYDEISEILDWLEEDAIGHNVIKEFISYVYEQKNVSRHDVDSDCIQLMTFHLSKGLEFKVVFIIDANEKLIPHIKSIRENDIETERRLFYVAMTRAKDFLYIFFTKNRFGKNFRASRFIVEALGGKDG